MILLCSILFQRAVDRSWHALDSVLPQEEANSEANQEKSGDVVRHTEKIVRSNDHHNQWGQSSTKDCRDIVRERDPCEADRRWKRFHHDARNGTNYSNGQADERVEWKQECGPQLRVGIEQIVRNYEADGTDHQYRWSAKSIRQPATQNTTNRKAKSG